MKKSKKEMKNRNPFMMDYRKKCTTCSNERIELQNWAIPVEAKKDFERFGKKLKYYFCPNCEQFSVVGNPECTVFELLNV